MKRLRCPMAYFSGHNELSGFGCGADCSCKSCRTMTANLSQVYERGRTAPTCACHAEDDRLVSAPTQRPGRALQDRRLGSPGQGGDLVSAAPSQTTMRRPSPAGRCHIGQRLSRPSESCSKLHPRLLRGESAQIIPGREPMSPLEEVRFWEKVIDWLPKIFEIKRLLEEKVRAGQMSRADADANLASQMRHVFPPGYALSKLDTELAAARCALSKARWQFMVWQRRAHSGRKKVVARAAGNVAELPVAARARYSHPGKFRLRSVCCCAYSCRSAGLSF